MASERSEETSGQNKAQLLLTLEQIKTDFPPATETFERTVREGIDIIEANVSRENGVIIYIEPGSAKFLQRASKSEDSGV